MEARRASEKQQLAIAELFCIDYHRRLMLVDAMLCGVLRADSRIFSRVDWDRAGVTLIQAQEWWQAHLNDDKDENRTA
jgi:hypothetical protein